MHETPDPRIAFFDNLAPHWDSAGQDAVQTVRRLDEVVEMLDLRPPLDLLEVGCGSGQITAWLASRVAPGRVVAVNFAEAMLEQARRKNVPAEFRRADVCAGDWEAEVFDVVFCFHAFPHFRDPPTAVRNMAGALRPDGRLIVIHLASRAQINAFHDAVGGAVAGDHLPARGDWEELLSAAGLRMDRWLDRDDLFFLEARRRHPALG